MCAIARAQSYGRAPTFLMATDYEQLRSTADSPGGNEAAAAHASGSASDRAHPRPRVLAAARCTCPRGSRRHITFDAGTQHSAACHASPDCQQLNGRIHLDAYPSIVMVVHGIRLVIGVGSS